MSWYVNLLFCVLAAGVVVAIGMYLGARRDLIASLHDRAERAEREQALQVSTARAGERTRIAREMHDVLAHRMSLVAVHAGALAYRTDLSAAETRETAAIIQANSQRALADLREILGLLRDTERGIDVTHHRPQPTLGDLDSLLDDERAAGAHVTLRSDLEDLDALPESIGRSAFRIVQEGLTNARKHAPHAIGHRRADGPPRERTGPVGAESGTGRWGARRQGRRRLRPRRARRTGRRQPWPLRARPDPQRRFRPAGLAAVGTMSGEPIRVVLVDDDPLVRAGLSLMLRGAPQLEIVGEAGDGVQALEVIARTRPDVVLMDIRMPRLDGLAATQRLSEQADAPAVIVLTTFDADEYVVRALANGATGFLLKDTSPPMIVEAIQKVAAGEPMLSPSVTTQLIRRVVADHVRRLGLRTRVLGGGETGEPERT